MKVRGFKASDFMLYKFVWIFVLFCLIKWKNRGVACTCSNYSLRAHKALFHFLSHEFFKVMLFQLSYIVCILCMFNLPLFVCPYFSKEKPRGFVQCEHGHFGLI